MAAPKNNKFEVAGTASIATAWWNDQLYVYSWTNKGVHEYICDRELGVLKHRVVPGSEKTGSFGLTGLVLQPSGDSAAGRLRLLLVALGTLTCVTPFDGKHVKVNMPIDADPANTCYSVAAWRGGLVVVATSISAKDVDIYTCTWAELETGKPLSKTSIPVPDAFKLKKGETFANQRAVCLASDDGIRLVVTLQHLTAPDKRAKIGSGTTDVVDLRLDSVDHGAVWTAMATETGIYDLNVTPDGHAVALGQTALGAGDGIRMWVRSGPGNWNELGDPTDGALGEAFGFSSVYIPHPRPLTSSGPGPSHHDRVLFLQPDPYKGVYWTFRSVYAHEALALPCAIDLSVVSVAGHAAYEFGVGDFTVELWARPEGDGPMLTWQAGSGDQPMDGWTFFRNADGTVSFEILRGEAQHFAVSTMIPDDGDWHHYAAVRRGGAFELYVDGVPKLDVQRGRAGRVEAGTGSTLCFGYDPRVPRDTLSAGRWFTGAVDEIRLWKRARAPHEIDQGRYHHMPANKPDLVGQWGFDLGLALDSSAVGNDARFDRMTCFVPAGVRFVPEGQPYVIAQTTLTEDWQVNAKGSGLQEVRAFRTVVSLKNSDGSPYLARQDDEGHDLPNIWVSASESCEISVRGARYTIGPDTERAFATDEIGRLPLAGRGDSLSHPVLFVRADFMLEDENIVVSPDRQALHQLSRITKEQVTTIDGIADDHAEDVAAAIRSAIQPALQYGVSDVGTVTAKGSLMATRAAKCQFYMPRESCPCCHTHSMEVKCDYRSDRGSMARCVTPEFMEHSHWTFDFKAKNFSPVDAEDAARKLAALGPSLTATGGLGGWSDDFGRFVRGEMKVAHALVTTVERKGEKVIHAVIHFGKDAKQHFVQAIQTVEDALAFVEGVVKQLATDVADALEQLIDAIKWTFAWNDIAATRDALSAAILAACDRYAVRATDGSLANDIRDHADEIWSSVTNGLEPLGDGDQSGNGAASASREDPVGELIQAILDSPQSRWLLDKLHELGLGEEKKSIIATDLSALGEDAVRITDDIANGIRSEIDLVQEKVPVYFTQEGGLLATTGDKVKGDCGALVESLYKTLTGPLLDDSVKLSGDTVKLLRDGFLDAKIDLPLVAWLLDPTGTKNMSVSPLSVLTTLAAIPITVACKATMAAAPDLSLLNGNQVLGDSDRARSIAEPQSHPAYNTLVVTTAVMEGVFQSLTMYIDLRTISRRMISLDAPVVPDFVWTARTRPAKVVGAVCFVGAYALPMLIAASNFTLVSTRPSDAGGRRLELAAQSGSLAGLVPMGWRVIKLNDWARKCGLGDEIRGIGFGAPGPDRLGVFAGLGISVASLALWIAYGIVKKSKFDGDAEDVVKSVLTGTAGVVAPISRLMLVDAIRTAIIDALATETAAIGTAVPPVILALGEAISAATVPALIVWRKRWPEGE